MGFDVSYHPISGAEIKRWYFNALELLKNGDEAAAADVAGQTGMDEFYVKKYMDTLKAGLNVTAEDSFDKTHGFYIAVMQGFFRKYFYVRGGAFSFLVEAKPEYRRYTESWADILGFTPPNKVADQITENYCSGVIIPNTKTQQLMNDIQNDAAVKADFDEYFSHGRLQIFLEALGYTIENDLSLLEATEVVEPNPLDLNSSSSYSNLFNCDPNGALLYRQAVIDQLAEAGIDPAKDKIERQVNHVDAAGSVMVENSSGIEIDPGTEGLKPKPRKKGFFAKLFGGKN